MPYAIIQRPFTLRFREMSKPELKSYYSWFMRMVPERLAELEGAVRESEAHRSWNADFSPDSLSTLGEWFATQVQMRTRTPDEIDVVKSRLNFPIEVPGEDLGNRSFSFAMDVGMYFSQVVLKNLPGTKGRSGISRSRMRSSRTMAQERIGTPRGPLWRIHPRLSIVVDPQICRSISVSPFFERRRYADYCSLCPTVVLPAPDTPITTIFIDSSSSADSTLATRMNVKRSFKHALCNAAS